MRKKRITGFNGAAALTLRKPDGSDFDEEKEVRLQWGRSVNAAETISWLITMYLRLAASMGPQR